MTRYDSSEYRIGCEYELVARQFHIIVGLRHSNRRTSTLFVYISCILHFVADALIVRDIILCHMLTCSVDKAYAHPAFILYHRLLDSLCWSFSINDWSNACREQRMRFLFLVVDSCHYRDPLVTGTTFSPACSSPSTSPQSLVTNTSFTVFPL